MATSSQVPPCPGGELYEIEPGDTLYQISRRRGITLDALLEANPGIDPENLQVGQQICIPRVDVPEPEPRPPERPLCPGGRLYRIRPGDTFYRISRREGISLDDLIAANPDVDPEALQVGQVICIPRRPVPTPPPVVCPGIRYTIQAGDTLYALAQRYNTTVDMILRYNPGLDPERLRVGQVICIPTRIVPPRRRKRCLVLRPTDNAPQADAALLLDYQDDAAIAMVTNVPDPSDFPGREQYVLWLRGPRGEYVSAPMSATPADLYVGRIKTERPLERYVAALITAEAEEYGDRPSGPAVATGAIPPLP